MAPTTAPPETPVTARAVILGLLAVLGINLVMNYNDYYLLNSLLIGNHFPVVAISLVFVLVVAWNAGLARRFGWRPFSPGELLLLWSMVGVGGGLCAAGFMRYFPSWMVNPAYYANGGNEFDKWILKELPAWMVVSKDSQSDVVRWFMEGLPHGKSIPWGAWVGPMAVWFAFALMLWASNLAIVSLFFRQWAERERLIFPVVQLPLALAAEPEKGKPWNALMSNWIMWLGFALPALLWGWSGLSAYFPTLPGFTNPLFNFWSIFPDRPWSEFRLDGANLYFSVIGMTFLLTTEMAFSLWAFFVLYRLSNVFIAWLGSGAGGFFGAWEQRITVFETGGAIVALTVFLLWGARRHLSEWWGRVLSGRRDAVADPIPARWAAFLIGAGIGGMIVWNLCTRMQWWAAVGSVLLYLMVLLILTRIVAESGLFFVQTNVIPADFIGGLTLPYTAADPNVVGAPAVAALAVPKPLLLTGRTIDVLMMHKAMLMHDLREIFMPYVMNGVKAATSVRMHAGKVLAVFGLTAVVGLGAAAYGRISTAYKYGGVNLDWYANIGEPDWVLNAAANYEKSPPSVDWIQAGEHKVLPVNVAHVVVGAALTAGMLLLRARFLWWPLHPFGLVMCGTWAISMFWFSIFLGWLFKACVMAFGGAGLYRKVLPFFLGLILGESVIAVGWLVLGLLTGTPGRIILPN